MKKILFPTDFTDIARNAGKYAVALAKESGKELVFFHAGNAGSEMFERMRQEVSFFSGLEPDVVMHHHLSAKMFSLETMNEIIASEQISLVVMGTIGRGAGLAKKLFGTNTESILEGANCPVIAVPPNYGFSGLRRIAYASDLGEFDEEMRRVISFARIFHANITVLHVSPVFPDLVHGEEEDVNRHIEHVKQTNQYANITYYPERMPHDNQIDKGIILFLENNTSDLLVMFHNKRDPFDKLFSASHTGNAVLHLGVPLMVFPKGRAL